MDLLEIKNPEFLKSLSIEEMEELAAEIRRFLIESISHTGGHLASNLGVVELTIALHYVFDSPKDKIFFDVGHQCYTHKILTGRAKYFNTLRQYKGLSGFEKRYESEHDVWEAGHSSTSLSAALGMAVARDLNHEDYQIIPVIGDGSISSGEAMEALNEIGAEKRKMIIVFNDNAMSISKNVGALTSNFSKLRASKGYVRLKKNMKRNLRQNEFGENVYQSLKSIKDAVRKSVIKGGIFDDFNLNYIGPVDGHNLHDLIQVFTAVKDHDGPVIVHVITKKGKGYAPCENDEEGIWHGVGPFDIETGRPKNEIPKGYSSWAGLFSETVRKMAEKDQNIVAVSPAMVVGSDLQKFFREFPERSFDTGITEDHAATFAAGLAISGKRPYLELYSSFLQRCYDQINHDICRMDLPVVIGIDHAGLVGPDGETHHGIYDIGLLTPLPHMILAQPKNGEEAVDLLFSAFHQSHPYGIRFPKGTVKIPEGHEPAMIKTGSWEVLHDDIHNKAVIFSYGDDVERILHKIEVNDLPVTVVNCRFFKPLDEDILSEITKRPVRFYCYEPDMLAGGLGSLILSWCNEHDVSIHLERFGIGDEYVQHGAARLLRKEMHIDLDSFMERVASETGEADQ